MSNQVEAILKALLEFRRQCPISTYGLPFDEPLPIEIALKNIWPRIQSLSSSDLKVLRSQIDLHYAVLFNCYAQRMASAAVRACSKATLLDALAAISMDENLLDDRDLYRTGVIFIDCSNRCKLDARSLYRDGLKLATDARRSLLERQLLSAPSYMRSLRSMGIVAQDDGARFTYVDNLFKWPTPIDKKRLDETVEELKEYQQGKEKRDKTI